MSLGLCGGSPCIVHILLPVLWTPDCNDVMPNGVDNRGVLSFWMVMVKDVHMMRRQAEQRSGSLKGGLMAS